MAKEGKVLQVIGPVVDVGFDESSLPPLYQALKVVSDGFEVPEPIEITVEVEQYLGESRCRCVAMEPTDGLIRGMKVVDTGGPITVPVGPATLGRVLNVIGQPVDKLGPVHAETQSPITGMLPNSKNSQPNSKCLSPGSKSSTYFARSFAAAR